MRRLATFRWQTPEPTSVDEELALFDDDSAWLVVCGSRTLEPTIGSYRCEPGEADRRLLVAAGPAPVDLDLLHPPADDIRAALGVVADRVSAAARSMPQATATFHAWPLGRSADGSFGCSLQVVSAGVRPVEFELDPTASSIQLSLDGRPSEWSYLPDLPAGFTTPDAVELGGVRRRAHIAPGVFGAIALEVPAIGDPTGVAAHIVGRLFAAFPDGPLARQFGLRTHDAPIHA